MLTSDLRSRVVRGAVVACEVCEPDSFEDGPEASQESPGRAKGVLCRVRVVYANGPSEGLWRRYKVMLVSADKEVPDAAKKPFALVGNVGDFPTKALIEVRGEFKTHIKYGFQLEALSRASYAIDTIEGLKTFIACVVQADVRAQTLDIDHVIKTAFQYGMTFAQCVETLTSITQDTPLPWGFDHVYRDSFAELGDSLRKYAAYREARAFAADHAMPDDVTEGALDAFGAQMPEQLRADPYVTMELPRGACALRAADDLAKRLGLAPNDLRRLAALIIRALTDASYEGHTRIHRDLLLNGRDRIYTQIQEAGWDETDIDAALDLIRLRGQKHFPFERTRVLQVRDYIALERLAVAEDNAARHLSTLSSFYLTPCTESASLWSIEPTVEQRAAVQMALAEPVSVLTGGPGTGKTTVTKTVLNGWTMAGHKVRLLAPTARAAKRMTEATGYEASTIHRAIKPLLTNNQQLEEDAIVIDESSMVDAELIAHLLSCIRPTSRVLFVGDVDQLPSVGPGRVLHDLIASKKLPVSRLTEVKRSLSDGGAKRIPEVASQINRGIMPDFAKKGTNVNLLAFTDITAIQDAVIQAVTTWLPAKGYTWQDVLVLSPQRGDTRRANHAIAVNGLNAALQSKLNPAMPGAVDLRIGRGQIARVGDRVRHTKNDYSMGAFNGDLGFVRRIETTPYAPRPGEQVQVAEDTKKIVAEVDYGDKVIGYSRAQAAMLDLAYAGTVHASQGSEAPCVVIVVHRSFAFTQTKNLVYTAHTRAKERVLYIGDPDALARALKTVRDDKRETGLQEALSRHIMD